VQEVNSCEIMEVGIEIRAVNVHIVSVTLKPGAESLGREDPLMIKRWEVVLMKWSMVTLEHEQTSRELTAGKMEGEGELEGFLAGPRWIVGERFLFELLEVTLLVELLEMMMVFGLAMQGCRRQMQKSPKRTFSSSGFASYFLVLKDPMPGTQYFYSGTLKKIRFLVSCC
jgi:hypothetical protein